MPFFLWVRRHAGKLIIFSFVAGFALGDFVGLVRLANYSEQVLDRVEPWLSEAKEQVEPAVRGAEDLVAKIRPHDSSDTLTGRVVGIADGDTLTLLSDFKQIKIRLAEIDTPEKGQPWANRAKQALSEKVFGESVRIEVETLDRYGRTVGKVWLGDRDVERREVMSPKAKCWSIDRNQVDGRSLLGCRPRYKGAYAGFYVGTSNSEDLTL